MIIDFHNMSNKDLADGLSLMANDFLDDTNRNRLMIILNEYPTFQAWASGMLLEASDRIKEIKS